MSYFNLEDAKIYQSAKLSHSRFFDYCGIWKNLSFFLAAACFLLGIFWEGFAWFVAYFFFILGILLFILDLFYKQGMKKPRISGSLRQSFSDLSNANLAQYLSFESAVALKNMDSVCKQNQIELNKNIVLYSFLESDVSLRQFFFFLGLDQGHVLEVFKDRLQEGGDEPISLDDLIVEATKIALQKNHDQIENSDFLEVVLKTSRLWQRFMENYDLTSEQVSKSLQWFERLQKKQKKRLDIFSQENLAHKGTVARDWAYGFTNTLDKYSFDITQSMSGRDFEIVGHENEVRQLQDFLTSPEKNNALLIGDEGTGRKSCLYDLADKMDAGLAKSQLNYCKLKVLDLSAILADYPNHGQASQIINDIFSEVAGSGNVILVIYDFHLFAKVDPAPGTINIINLILPFMRLPQFRFIATTDFANLHKVLEANQTLMEQFRKIEVQELSRDKAIEVVENFAYGYQGKYRKIITYPAVEAIMDLCEKYFTNAKFPQKAINLLDECCVHAFTTLNEEILTVKIVNDFVAKKLQVPIGSAQLHEKEVLINLENLIHERLINQEQAVEEIANALRRARTQVSSKKGPIGGFLFLGPTGTGKTETAKSLAAIYFGAESKMIRLDMAQFQTKEDIARLLGGDGREGLLTTPVLENPFSVVLIDEVEKAHPDILNLFLTVLDEGYIKDGLGRMVSFSNTIVIFTSNAGYQIILDCIARNEEWFKVKNLILDYLFQQGLFKPELINRFDCVVVFKPLSQDHLLQIAEIQLKKIVKNLEEKRINLVITNSLKMKIAEWGYDPKFGAREMKRVIQDKVENVLAQEILAGRVTKGDRIELVVAQDKLNVKKLF